MSALTQPCQLQGRLVMPSLRRSHPFTFVLPYEFHTQRLAYMLDSLVRVSRRVEQSRFTNDYNKTVDAQSPNPTTPTTGFPDGQHCRALQAPKRISSPINQGFCFFLDPNRLRRQSVYNIWWPKPPNYLPPPLCETVRVHVDTEVRRIPPSPAVLTPHPVTC